MTEYVIRVAGHADRTPTEATGQYVVSYDPDGHDGQGDATLSLELSKAKRFKTGAAAFEFWRQQAAPPHELRPDGKPNRPLTCFTVEIRRV